MSTQINDGGPAFPTQDKRIEGMGICFDTGMSLRDWFAGQALGQVVQSVSNSSRHMEWREVAYITYAVADAMLAARAPKEAKQ